MTIKIEFPTKQVPNFVINTAKVLISNGYSAFLVGGAVRDLLLERKVKDFDITTNALPEQVESIFPKSISTGAKFGNIIVIAEDEFKERHDVDVTTFRQEENYFGGRWPTKVEYTTKVEDDLSRRDFTINAMAIDIQLIIDDVDRNIPIEKIVDPFLGISDILSGTIRAVGEPEKRFGEDGLRAFRACRLATELTFTIEEETFKAIRKSTNIANKVSMERIRDELLKMIHHSPIPSNGIRLMDELNLLQFVIPELVNAKNITQPLWHSEDVFNHSLKTMDLAEDNIKIAALLHDIGKTETISEDEKGIHFFGHDKTGAEISEKILKRLKFSNSEIKRITNLIRWHMFYYPSADWRKENQIKENNNSTEKTERKKAFKHGWTDSAIRRFIKKVGGEEQIEDLIKLRIADASANEKSTFDPKEIQALEKRISEVREKDMVLKVSDLNITGNDLMNLGVNHGPKIGKILNNLLEMVLDEPNLNSYKELEKRALILLK